MRATHGARGDIDGEPPTSQPSELGTEDDDKSGDDDEDSDNFDTEESAAAADDDDVDETRSPGYGSYDDAWQLAPEVIFLIGSRCWFGRTIRFSGRFFRQWQNQISKALKAKLLNSHLRLHWPAFITSVI